VRDKYLHSIFALLHLTRLCKWLIIPSRVRTRYKIHKTVVKCG